MKRTIWMICIMVWVLTACSGGGKETPAASLSVEEIQARAQQTVNAQSGSLSSIAIKPLATQTSVATSIPNIEAATTSSVVIQRPIESTPTTVINIARPAVPTIAPNYVQAVNTICERVRFVDDVTVPDNMVMTAGQTFRKTWRIQNAGSCTWTPAYQLAFYDGDQMAAPATVSLGRSVAPNETVDISVDMVAPYYSGVFQSNWRMKNPYGVLFGTANSENPSIWTKIVVGSGTAAVATTPGVMPTVGGAVGNCSVITAHPPRLATYARGEETDFYWTIRNDSAVTWTTQSMDLSYIAGTNMLKRPEVTRWDLPYDVPPGGQIAFSIDAIIPYSAGNYSMTFGIVSGYEVICSVEAVVSALW